MLYRSISGRLIVGIAVALTVLLFAVGSTTNAGAQTAPGLGAAASYAVLGGRTVTNTGPTTIDGDVGVSPGTAVTGFPPGILTGGTIHSADANALQAQGAVTTAYLALAAEPCTADLTGQDLGGLTLTEGVYCFSASAQLTGQLTLNAQGNASAVFVFKMASTLITASNSSVMVTNGSTGCNVFWQVGSSATIGTGTVFEGNILALTSITLNTDASVSGRALAQNGAVTLDSNHVGFEACAASPTASPTASATVTPSTTATAAPTGTGTVSATPTAAATPTPPATPVGQTPTPSATPVGQTPTPTPIPTATPVGQAPTPTPTATPFGPTLPPHITPCCLPRNGGHSSQGDQIPWTLLLAGLVASSLGASTLVLGARARRRGAQQAER